MSRGKDKLNSPHLFPRSVNVSNKSLTRKKYIYMNVILNNYWMRFCMISLIIKTEVCVICRSRITLCILGHLGLVFIWSCFVSCLLFLLFYVSLRNLCSGTCRKIHCFIIRFSHTSYSETEAKHSAILFLRRTLQGA